VLVSASRRNNLLPAIAFIFSVFIAVPGTAQDKIDKGNAQIRYAAIGDSYSIGEGASPNESWPALLTRHLNEKGLQVDLVANPSVTGWTTEQAIERELPIFLKEKPNFGTLLIGVNDWVQGVDAEKFRKNFSFLVDQMLGVLRDKNRLLVVTIPDFGVTPKGSRYARGRNISEGILRFNKIIIDESRKRELRVVDIFPLSKKMHDDPSLVAKDGLHPSAKEYAEWEKIIFPAALELLKR
jgi:lysophospholipase L1-like esterase